MSDLLFVVADAARNPLYTAVQFAGALAETGTHSVAGWGSGPTWFPLREEPFDLHRLSGWRPWRDRDVRALAAVSPTAVGIYAFKAMPSSFGMSLAAGKLRDLPVGLHLDDWDAGYFDGVPPLRRLVRGARDLGVPGSDLWLRWWERQIPRADFLTVSSNALQQRFGGTVVRQGVDTRRFDPARFPREEARRRLSLPADVPIAAFAGTPRKHKGIQRAARILSRGRVRLLIAGVTDPATANELRDLGVHVVGSYPFAEAGWVWAAADVAVIPQEDTPYAHHQLPAKLLHAMALGVPVVATDIGDAKALLQGTPEAGTVIPHGDDGALVEAIERYGLDEQARRLASEEARRRAVESYGWSSMSRQLSGVLADAGIDPTAASTTPR